MDSFDAIESQTPDENEDMEQQQTPKRNYSTSDNENYRNKFRDENDTNTKQQQQQQQEKKKEGCLSTFVYDDAYVRRFWEGRLKVLELICSFIATVFLPGSDDFYILRFIFFRLVATIAFASIAFDLFLHIFSQWNRLPNCFRSSRFMFFMTGIGAISFLAVTSLVIVAAGASDNERNALVASFCGYMTMIAFLVETALHFLKMRAMSPYQVD